MQLIKKILRKFNKNKSRLIDYQYYKESINDKNELIERSKLAYNLNQNPLLNIILNQLEVATATEIASTDLSKKDKIMSLSAYLKAISYIRLDIDSLINLDIEE